MVRRIKGYIYVSFDAFRTLYLIVGYGGLMITLLVGAAIGYALRHFDVFKQHGV